MKRRRLTLLVVVIGIGLIGTRVMATETEFTGQLRVRGELFDETTVNNSDDTDSLWDTRLRLQVDFVASDNLKGVYQLEIGDITWGDKGGRLGTDEVNVETRHLYLDFNIPHTPLNAKGGLMPLKLGHGIVFDNDAAALLLSANLDPVMMGAFTFKDYEGDTVYDDDTDFYGLFVNTNLDDVGSVGLFGAYARNRDAGEADAIASNWGVDVSDYDKLDAYWIGLSVDLAVDPIIVAFETNYFTAELNGDEQGVPAGNDLDSDGWLLYGDIATNLEPVKLGIAGLYATGNDGNTIDDDHSEAFVPILPTDPEDACVVNWDNLLLLDGALSQVGGPGANMVSNLVSGKLYAETAPLEALNLGLSFQGYWLEEEVKASGAGNGDYIGTEGDLEVAYNIYDQLTYEIESAYMVTDDDVWGKHSEDIWFLSHKLIYSF